MKQPPASIQILIIDDDIAAGNILSDLLSADGHHVTVAQSGAEGLYEAHAHLPELVLLDMMMPDMDGIAVCTELRANPLTAEVPILMITALNDRASRLRGLEAGADEFLTKPVDNTELRLRVRTIAKVNRYRRLLDERERTVVALSQARDAALEASRLKSTFITTFSHELRTPLVGIIGMSEILLTTTLSHEQQECAQALLKSGQDLLAVINDILDFTSLESGTWELTLVPFDLATTLATTTRSFQPEAQAKGLGLSLVLGPETAMPVSGDKSRLELVLRKLLNNALKFTVQGQIQVSAAFTAETAEQVTLRCHVSDTGIGIAEEARASLFQAFRQVDGSHTRRYGGLGLGLALSKRLVEQMGGEIGVESTEGQGTVFWFQIPLSKEQ